MATGTCTHTTWIAREILGLGFRTCQKDCVGAAITDGMLALHAIYAVRAIALAGRGPLARTAVQWPLINAAWSSTGVLMWYQPGGVHPFWWELLWRANALVQAGLVAIGWLMVLAMLDALDWLTPTRSRALKCIAAAHGAAFALITALPATCAFDDYVLFGGANLSPPLMCAAGTRCCRDALLDYVPTLRTGAS